MKILILPSWYPNPFHTTTGDFVMYQARLLQRAGVDVSVLYNQMTYRNLRQPLSSIHFNVERGVSTTRIAGFALPKVNSYFLKKWVDGLEEALEMHLKKWGRPDLIHAHVWMGGYAAQRIAKRLKIP
ncbi:MAG: glycosyltransferase, partial [Saprospiraceae bacterium]